MHGEDMERCNTQRQAKVETDMQRHKQKDEEEDSMDEELSRDTRGTELIYRADILS